MISPSISPWFCTILEAYWCPHVFSEPNPILIQKKKIWRQITIQSYWNPVLNLHSTAFVLNRLPIKKKRIIIMFPIIVNYPWRIHGAGIYIYANMTGVHWWDPWHTIYSSTMDPSPGPPDVQLLVLDLQLLKVDDVQVFCQPIGKDIAFRGNYVKTVGKSWENYVKYGER